MTQFTKGIPSGQDRSPEGHESLTRREKIHNKVEQRVSLRGHVMEKGDIYKFIGLITFFVVILAVCFVLWPYVSDLFEEGGTTLLISEIRAAGLVGVFMLLGLQLLQVVVAFIPGEVVQIVAGMLYGPWLGAFIILIGCVLSSAFIFVLVRKLGTPFVQAMVPTKQLETFRRFERSGKLNIIVFILFLIPGLPKDVFTYLVPLTDMRMRTFLVLATVGRVPGVVVSTYAASGLVEGRITESVIIFAVAALFVVIGVVFRQRIMGFVEKHLHGSGK